MAAAAVNYLDLILNCLLHSHSPACVRPLHLLHLKTVGRAQFGTACRFMEQSQNEAAGDRLATQRLAAKLHTVPVFKNIALQQPMRSRSESASATARIITTLITARLCVWLRAASCTNQEPVTRAAGPTRSKHTHDLPQRDHSNASRESQWA